MSLSRGTKTPRTRRLRITPFSKNLPAKLAPYEHRAALALFDLAFPAIFGMRGFGVAPIAFGSPKQ